VNHLRHLEQVILLIALIVNDLVIVPSFFTDITTQGIINVYQVKIGVLQINSRCGSGCAKP
jgi:hypothetical protein